MFIIGSCATSADGGFLCSGNLAQRWEAAAEEHRREARELRAEVAARDDSIRRLEARVRPPSPFFSPVFITLVHWAAASGLILCYGCQF